MTLEFEKLTGDLEKMAAAVVRRQRAQQAEAERAMTVLSDWANRLDDVRAAVELAEAEGDEKYFRAARPLDDDEPLDAAIDAPSPPTTATIMASDGSQILPDRHAAFLYYLVNIGAIVFRHGVDDAPDVLTQAYLVYPDAAEGREQAEGPQDADPDETDERMDAFQATVRRDQEEIKILADWAWENRFRAEDEPVLTLLDQRLLYWPFGGESNEQTVIMGQWWAAMTKVRDAGALLAGYIDRSRKRSVVNMLAAVTATTREERQQIGRTPLNSVLSDAQLFAHLLAPGQRSRVYCEISPTNKRFVDNDPDNEVCFFYLNPSAPFDSMTPGSIVPDGSASLARIDIPISVARNPATVATVHALIYDQCRIVGDYPYVLARADEMAVVGRRDAAELNFMMDIVMERHGASGTTTAKQDSKGLARGGRTRHESPGPRR